jgi:xanthine dehydrogenase YagR molybdenum-binding subunit
MESIMDMLAYKIGMDPVAFRKKNTTDPYYHRQLDTGAKAIGWENRPQKPGEGPLYGPFKSLRRGMGCGMATWGGGGFPSCQVDVFIQPDGGIAVQVGTQDLGTGTRTYMAAIVAEEFGLPIKSVEVRIGSSKYGMSNPSGGSTTVGSLAPAVKEAVSNARLAFVSRLAPALGAKAEEIGIKGGRFTAKNGKSFTWKQACASLGRSGIAARGEWNANLQGSGLHGVNFAEVEVDIETGKVRVLKMVGVQDCGLPLNRTGVESQINGGMTQALGFALTENHTADPILGIMLNPSLDDYKLPGCFEMPEMIPIIDDGDERNVVIGMAEPAVIPGAGAIANAVFSACGVRVKSVPITPEKILRGLERLKRS